MLYGTKKLVVFHIRLWLFSYRTNLCYVLTVCYYHAFIVDRCFVVCFFRNLKRSTAFAENLLIVILVVAVYTQREKKPHYRQANK